jgi:tRNA pseudouridine55 synthase
LENPYSLLLPNSPKEALQKIDFEAGCLLLVNKPQGWTSFDVVAKLRNTLKVKKIGHAGTLDPLATGLLLVATGKRTKLLNELQNYDKEYVATFCFGATTPSYDAEFEPDFYNPTDAITIDALKSAFLNFEGEIQQTPPPFSAIKIDGKKAYQLARRQKEVKLEPRKVTIYSLKLISFLNPQNVQAIVHCSKGTYIRSLAHDLGQFLKVGAYLKDLRRTRIGNFNIADAWELADIIHMLNSLGK